MNLREIDTLVAEKVMGFEVTKDGERIEDGKRFGIPSYSQKIEHAWQVVEKLRKEGTYLVVCSEKDKYAVNVWIDDSEERYIPYTSVESEIAELAICLAALKVEGVEVEVDG